MKSNRDLVLDLLEQYGPEGDESNGVTTQQLAKWLNMQRTNISSILNTLVKEGAVEKSNTRPVFYRIKKEKAGSKDASCFANFIGYKGSMKRNVQLAKAAILYPRHSLHSLITGPTGTGKAYFASLMHQFAIERGILMENAPFVHFNCDNYIENTEAITSALFGIREDGQSCYMERAENGILFIEHGNLLPSSARNKLFRFLENNYYVRGEQRSNTNTTIVCSIADDAKKSILDLFQNQFTVILTLPPLEDMQLQERFELIQGFFSGEAESSNRTLSINSEILICLLLYNCTGHINQLKNDIKIACANAYVREFHDQKEEIKIILSDFPYYVRTGLLSYKSKRYDLKDLISENSNYVFYANAEVTKEHNKEGRDKEGSIYGWIDQKSSQLRELGLTEKDINTIVSIDIDNEFKTYSSRLSKQVVNKEQLAQLVGSRVIHLVTEFLDDATRTFKRIYPVTVFYGLCLHLNSTLSSGEKRQKLTNERIMEVIEKYRDEYALSMKFVGRLEKEYSVSLPIDEVVFITMFISDETIGEEEISRPAVLIAMHGDNVASSVATVVKSLSGLEIYAYDMPLDKKTQDAYDDLKDVVTTIDCGKGIMVLYDMGSLKEIFEMLSLETGINIKLVEIPLTVLALDCCRRVMLNTDVESAYNSVMERYINLPFFQNHQYHRPKSGNTIITLCMSGEGGALQLKSYLEKHLPLVDTEVIPLSISDKKLLLAEINRINEDSHILCTIGTYDPQLVGIPYIPMADVFACPTDDLQALINSEYHSEPTFDENSRVILEHLGEELANVDVNRLRVLLPKIIVDIDREIDESLTMNQKVGLLVHIACCIDRTIAGEKEPINIHKDEIIDNNKELYKQLITIFQPIERGFQISLGNHEYAHIISIIKKSRRG